MIKGTVEVYRDDPNNQELLFVENNLVVDGLSESIADFMCLPPDASGAGAASALYDTSNYTIQTISFGKAPEEYYKNAHSNTGVTRYLRDLSGIIAVVSNTSSYSPELIKPDSPTPMDTVLADFNNVEFPTDESGNQLVTGYSVLSGTLIKWGSNATNQAFNLPNTRLQKVVGGNTHFLGLDYSGSVISWGLGDAGFLNVPQTLGACKDIVAGENWNAAVKTNGEVVVWGYDISNLLPNDLESRKVSHLKNIPTAYQGSFSAITSVEADPLNSNYRHKFLIGLLNTGACIYWGSWRSNTNYYVSGVLPVSGVVKLFKFDKGPSNNPFARISLPDPFLQDEGPLSGCFGYLTSSNNTSSVYFTEPFPTKSAKPAFYGPYTNNFIKYSPILSSVLCKRFYPISCGTAVKSYAYITSANVVSAFDSTQISQNINTRAPNYLPEQLFASAGNVSSITGYDNNYAILKNDGTVIWYKHDLTNFVRYNVPSSVQGSTIQISHNEKGLAFLKNDRTIVMSALPGQSFSNGVDNIPVALQTRASAISLSNNNLLVLATDGTISSISNAVRSQVVGGITRNYYASTVPVGLQGSCTSIQTGNYASIAVLKNNTASSWPIFSSYYPQIANSVSSVPAGLANVSTVSVSMHGHACAALTTGGSVSAWGSGLGDGNAYSYTGNYSSVIPNALQGNCVWLAIGSSRGGTSFSESMVGVKSDGTVFSWKDQNIPSYHTNPSIGSITYKVELKNYEYLSSIKSVAVGTDFSLALFNNGTLSAMGYISSAGVNWIPGATPYAWTTTHGSPVMDFSMYTYGPNFARIPTALQGNCKYVTILKNIVFALDNNNNLYTWTNEKGTIDNSLTLIPTGDHLSIEGLSAKITQYPELDLKVLVGLDTSTIPLYTSFSDTDSFFSSETFMQNINVIPFSGTIINKITTDLGTVNVIPSGILALTDGAYPPSGGIKVYIASGQYPYAIIASSVVSGNFNTKGSMDFRGYVNKTSATSILDASNGLIVSSTPSLSSTGEVIFAVSIASSDAAMANVYGGITQMGLWGYNLKDNISNGLLPPYTFKRSPSETGTYIEPLTYKLFAKKVFADNIVRASDSGSAAGLLNHSNLRLIWRLRFL